MPQARRSGDEGSIKDARQALVRASTVVNVVAPVVTAVAAFAGCWLALQLSAPSAVQELAAGLVALVLSVPFGVAVSVRMRHLTGRAESLSDARQERIDEAGRHQDFSSKVADALDMAGTEPEALQVIERASSARSQLCAALVSVTSRRHDRKADADVRFIDQSR